MALILARGLLVALVAATALAAAWPPAGWTPRPGGETTLWLSGASLARDSDLALDEEDGARFREAFGRAPVGIWSAAGRLDPPALPALATVAGAWLAPQRGPALVQGLLFALAAAALWRGTRARLGESTAPYLLVALFGSAAFTAAFRLQAETLAFAAVAIAGAALWGRPAGRVAAPDDVYRGELPGGEGMLRWLVAGAGFGTAATLAPAYLVLALPALAARPRSRRTAAAALFAAGFVAPFLAALAVGGAPWEPIQPVADFALQGWNLAYLIAGRHVGLAPYFLPLLLALAAPARDPGLRFVPLSVLLAALLLPLAAPYDFAGEGSFWGNPAFLPVYALALFAIGRPPSRGALALTLAAALPFVAPLWLAPRSGSPTGLGPMVTAALERPRDWLPFETSLRTLPEDAAVERGGVVLRSAGRQVFADAEGGLVFFGRRGEVAVYSARPLSSVRLEFAGEAPSSLEVAGGEVGNTTFRPSGQVAFDVAVGEAARRHPVWWSREPVSVYFLDLRLGRAPSAPLRFDLELARPAAPRPQGEAGEAAP